MIPFRELPRFAPGAKGDLYRRKANGDLEAIPTPVGASLGSHVLVTGDADDPQWLQRSGVSVVISVPATASGAWATGSVAAMRMGMLKLVEANQSCAVRLYNRASVRTADLARLRTTLPDPGSGVLAESWLSLTNSRKQYQSSVPTIYNADEPTAATFYWAVQNNMDVTVPITVTLTLFRLE